MKNKIIINMGLIVSFTLGVYQSPMIAELSETTSNKTTQGISNKLKNKEMKLGAFSISISVKDIKVSKAFYETLGFTAFGGSLEQNYLIMKNENALVGLFQGMFEGNILTFNPGWDENAHNIDDFQDIREIQKHLKTEEIKLISEADENATGPASLMLKDPDGNMILIDQHR